MVIYVHNNHAYAILIVTLLLVVMGMVLILNYMDFVIHYALHIVDVVLCFSFSGNFRALFEIILCPI